MSRPIPALRNLIALRPPTLAGAVRIRITRHGPVISDQAGTSPTQSGRFMALQASFLVDDDRSVEAQWRARAIEEAARATDAGPGTSEVDDKPPLKKADKLPSQFDGGQTKAVHTVVIVPDQSVPLSTGLSRRSGSH